MSDDLNQYKDLYLETSHEYLQTLNNSLLKLEKAPGDPEAIAEVFRSAHSLKSQSAAMGYHQTGFLCHAVEDVFFEVKEGRLQVTPELSDVLFAAFDTLTAALAQIAAGREEPDTTAHVEALKKLTGVTTEGAGASRREAGARAVGASAVESASPDAVASQIKTIPVKVEQLDEIVELLGELLVQGLVLKKLSRELNSRDLADYQGRLEKLTEALQFAVMSVRAVPMKMVFDHFPRAVRDLARTEQKQVELIMEGEQIELDRTIVERLDEPLIHIIRNAVSHGIGPAGTIRLSARREKDYVVVEVADDGRGVDWPAVAKKAGVETTDPDTLKNLLFSGISTSQAVTQVSGRGVGLGVVKKTIEEFGGSIDVASESGHGTTFIIKLPLTLAVLRALLVRVGQERYAVPVSLVDRSVKLAPARIKGSAKREFFVLDESEVPLIRLANKFQVSSTDSATGNVAVVAVVDGERVGLLVDDVIETAEIVVKPVPAMLRGNPAFAGVTILGDGQIALIVNPQGLM